MTVHFYCRHLTHKSLACRRLDLSHPVCHLAALVGLAQMCKMSGRVCMMCHSAPQLWPPCCAWQAEMSDRVCTTVRKQLPAKGLTHTLLRQVGKCLRKTVISQEYMTVILLVVMMPIMGVHVQRQSMLWMLTAGRAQVNIQFQHMTLITVRHPDRCLVGLLQLPISSGHITQIMIDHPDQCIVSLLQLPISSRHMTLLTADHPDQCTVSLLQLPISSRHLTLITADHPDQCPVSVLLQLPISSRHALTLWPQAMPVRILATAGM